MIGLQALVAGGNLLVVTDAVQQIRHPAQRVGDREATLDQLLVPS
jgi:hypothetical protein